MTPPEANSSSSSVGSTSNLSCLKTSYKKLWYQTRRFKKIITCSNTAIVQDTGSPLEDRLRGDLSSGSTRISSLSPTTASSSLATTSTLGTVVFLSAATAAFKQTSTMFPPKLRQVRSMYTAHTSFPGSMHRSFAEIKLELPRTCVFKRLCYLYKGFCYIVTTTIPPAESWTRFVPALMVGLVWTEGGREETALGWARGTPGLELLDEVLPVPVWPHKQRLSRLAWLSLTRPLCLKKMNTVNTLFGLILSYFLSCTTYRSDRNGHRSRWRQGSSAIRSDTLVNVSLVVVFWLELFKSKRRHFCKNTIWLSGVNSYNKRCIINVVSFYI